MNLIPSKDELFALDILVKNAVDSGYFKKLGGYSGILMIALYAKEMGLPVMHSLYGGMQNIQGKIEISARMMNSMIRKAGHKLQIDSKDDICTITGIRCDTNETYTASF